MFVIPMAGESSRFLKAGYDKPKYMLSAFGKSLLEHSLFSFKNYFDSKIFLFILNNQFNSKDFVIKKINLLGIKYFEIVNLNYFTRGQAETVFLGLKHINYTGQITIFNIDTQRLNFIYPKNINNFDGFVEVFYGKGDIWSFVKTNDTNLKLISEMAEKKRISNLCCTGLYHFNNVNDFFSSYRNYVDKPKNEWEKEEIYVAPLYNDLIINGKKYFYKIISKNNLNFFGTPKDYCNFLKLKKTKY